MTGLWILSCFFYIYDGLTLKWFLAATAYSQNVKCNCRIDQMKVLKIISLLFITNLSYSQNLDDIQNLVEKQEFDKAINEAKLLEREYYCEQQEILGFCYWRLNEFRSAINYYQNYVNSCGSSITPYANIGDSYFKLGIGDSAFVYFSKACELDPDNHIVNFNLGMINYTSSYDADAKKHYR